MDELIVKCLLGEGSREEEARLKAWVNASVANLQYYESFKAVHELTSIEPEVEWRRFKRSVAPKYVQALAIAASLVLVLFVVWPEKQSVKQLVQQQPVIRHTLSGAKQYRLADSSMVWLNGELSWQEPFHRAVAVRGAAKFSITKDATHPFTVRCKNFMVTVLGTIFTVDEQSVRVYEGKVMVEAQGKKYYLLPGEQFTLAKNPVSKSHVVQPAEDIPLPEHDRGNWYMFNNQSLSQVFDQLKQLYDADIVYNEADLQKMYFIGRFGKSDSIETILRQIATLNHLTLVKENERYIISK